jgi:hypothetical protein
VASHGTYRATHLARGTYALSMCVTAVTPTIHAVGTLDLMTNNGATLHGAIDAEIAGALVNIAVTVTGGTKRFAGATGELSLALVQFNQSGCDPRIGICLFWDEKGTIDGAVVLHH